MTERQLQFRVGLFVIFACAAIGVMVFQFGKLKKFWEPTYSLAIHFDSAPGVYASTPVRKNGIEIGDVRRVSFHPDGGVMVIVDIKKKYPLREDTEARLVRSLLGDASIDFTPGRSQRFLKEKQRIEGVPSVDPMQLVQRLESKVTLSLESFQSTSREWERVGRNLNSLMETNRGNLDVVIERTAKSLDEFTKTMTTMNRALANADKILGDPQNQQNLRRTLASMPKLVEETQGTISAVRSAVTKADENLANLEQFTEPLGRRSVSLVDGLDNTLGNLESLSEELNEFAQAASRKDGTLHKFATDPTLYRNLNDSAESLAVLLKNLEPVIRDMRVFSDKVARHPEILGVSGAMKGSSGIKEPPMNPEYRQSRQPGNRPTRTRN